MFLLVFSLVNPNSLEQIRIKVLKTVISCINSFTYSSGTQKFITIVQRLHSFWLVLNLTYVMIRTQLRNLAREDKSQCHMKRYIFPLHVKYWIQWWYTSLHVDQIIYMLSTTFLLFIYDYITVNLVKYLLWLEAIKKLLALITIKDPQFVVLPTAHILWIHVDMYFGFL